MIGEEYLTKIQALIKNKNVISKMHSLLKQFYNSLLKIIDCLTEHTATLAYKVEIFRGLKIE